MSYISSEQYFKYKSIEWSFFGNNLSLDGINSFEIDIKPSLTKESVIVELLFTSGILPTEASLTSDLYFGVERWQLSWTKKIHFSIYSNLRRTFQQYFDLGRSYEAGWQKKDIKVFSRQTIILRERWHNKKRSTLGGRNFDDIIKLGFGPHEVVDVGFVWYGPVRSKRTYEVQTYPYSDSKNFNQAIRYFLQRGFSLNEALNMNSKQMENLNNQAISALVLVMLAGSSGVARGGEAPVTISEQVMDISLSVINHPKNPHTPNTISLFEALTKQFRNASIEKQIQSISKIKQVDIPKLKPL